MASHLSPNHARATRHPSRLRCCGGQLVLGARAGEPCRQSRVPGYIHRPLAVSGGSAVSSAEERRGLLSLERRPRPTRPYRAARRFYDRRRATYGEDSFLWLRLLMQQPIYRLLEPLIWFHTEHSALGLGRRTPFPVPPLLDHVEEVLGECPSSHRSLLRRYLDWYALLIAQRLAEQGEGWEALRLLGTLQHTYYAGDPETRTRYDRIRRRAWFWPVVRLRNAVRKHWTR